ncbi:hypothetical protein BGX28_005354 [Mortierella sp. GBA30]|nr:hypothetical protein BGX28_005354 [Mortierella sp. GBA30]
MHTPSSPRLVLLTALGLLLSTALPGSAAPDPVLNTCYTNGCSTVFSTLAPCGGGVSNDTFHLLEQDLVYTPTASLGGCQCNSKFFNAFSSCLACISSVGSNSPEIDNQQDWVSNCKTYGFDFTELPVTNSTNSDGDNGDDGNNGSGLSKGAIAGIVIGALAVIALIGALFFIRSRRQKQDKVVDDMKFEQPAIPTNHTGGLVASATTPQATDNEFHSTAYPSTHDQDTDYYTNQHAAYQEPYASGQTQQDQYYSNGYPNSYYGASPNDTMMRNFDNNNNNHSNTNYVPPPPHPGTPSSPTAVAAAPLQSSPRPSESMPQSLRSRPKGWGDDHQRHLSSDISLNNQVFHNDKAEFDEGEELEPPRSRDRFVNDRDDFTSRRSMTPPRANMQSYREEYHRPSVEQREPYLSGSDRGSVTGLDIVRGGGGTGEHTGDDLTRGSLDSPESARRRARAAELFSAEGTRR